MTEDLSDEASGYVKQGHKAEMLGIGWEDVTPSSRKNRG